MPVVEHIQRFQALNPRDSRMRLGSVPASPRPRSANLRVVVASPDAGGAAMACAGTLSRPWSRMLKTGFDVCAAAAAIVVLAPVMALVAVLVSLDGGPVFFAHRRIGAQGRTFSCLKFRSMVTDGEAALQAHFKAHPEAVEEWASTHKLRHDPRVTAIGRILRKTSLDELPQLFNVLRLDMSLVGPRPITSLEICKYADCIQHYYDSRPGITGLWQVSGRGEASYERRVQLDTHYATNWSMWLDMTILARTLPAVISGRGAT